MDQNFAFRSLLPRSRWRCPTRGPYRGLCRFALPSIPILLLCREFRRLRRKMSSWQNIKLVTKVDWRGFRLLSQCWCGVQKSKYKLDFSGPLTSSSIFWNDHYQDVYKDIGPRWHGRTSIMELPGNSSIEIYRPSNPHKIDFHSPIPRICSCYYKTPSHPRVSDQLIQPPQTNKWHTLCLIWELSNVSNPHSTCSKACFRLGARKDLVHVVVRF